MNSNQSTIKIDKSQDISPYLDYERYPFADHNGEYFLSDLRSASREFKRGGETEIQLEFGGITVIGTTLQYEKAEDVCRIWVEEGRISINFHEIQIYNRFTQRKTPDLDGRGFKGEK